MSDNNVQSALSFAFDLQNTMRRAKSNSLIEFSKPTRIEPIVLLDNKLTNLSFMPDVMQALNSIFSAYYLQAVSLMVNVGKVDVVGLLDSVNPDRDPYASSWKKGILSTMENLDSYEHALPIPGEATGLEAFGEVAMERYGSNTDKDKSTTGKTSLDAIKTPSTLAVGKMLEVEVSSDGQRATFPVNVRLIPVGAKSEDIVRTFSIGAKDMTFMGRIHGWRSGRLELVKDLILCQDLIEDHKKGLIRDKTGIYKDANKRKNKNFVSTLLSGNPSVATASNIIVLSESTAKQLEKEIGGKLDRFRTREKLFDETATMLMVVINPDWEAVTIYHRSIEAPSELTSGDLKQMGKKEVDIGDILKSYQLGNSPSF